MLLLEQPTTSLYTAVVRSADGVRFTACAPIATELSARLLDYVSERCDYALWPKAAARVRAMMAEGDVDGAIATYFEHVGRRWDEERLEFSGPNRAPY